MEGLSIIPLDVIFHHICPYLSLWDLRQCMRVSKSWFFAMISDGAFAHFKAKILRISPELKVIFDEHPWEYGDSRTASSMRPSKGKKHRKAWIIPKGGTWYVMKRYLDKGRTIGGLRKLNDDRILFAVIKRMLVPVEKDHLVESISRHFNFFEANYPYYYLIIINGHHNIISIPKNGSKIRINEYTIASQACLSGFNNGFSLSSWYKIVRNRRRYKYDGVYAESMTKGV